MNVGCKGVFNRPGRSTSVTQEKCGTYSFHESCRHVYVHVHALIAFTCARSHNACIATLTMMKTMTRLKKMETISRGGTAAAADDDDDMIGTEPNGTEWQCSRGDGAGLASGLG